MSDNKIKPSDIKWEDMQNTNFHYYYIAKQAKNTPFADFTVMNYINRMIEIGYTKIVPVGNGIVKLVGATDTDYVFLTSDIQVSYAEMVLKFMEGKI